MTLRLLPCVLLAAFLSSADSQPAPTLRFRTKVSCTSWGPGCWIPGFVGTDSSPLPVPGAEIVVVGSYKDSVLYGINGTSGSVLWSLEGAGGEDSPKLLGTDVFAWGGLKGPKLFRVDALTGKVRWEWSPPSGVGDITTSGGVDATRGLVFAGTADGSSSSFFGVNATSGATVWTYAAGGEMWGTLGPLLVDDDLVCVGVGGSANPYASPGAALHCLQRDTGALAWKAPTGKQIQSRASLGNTSVFVGDYDHCVYAVGRGGDHAQLWKTCTEGIVEGSTTVATQTAEAGARELVIGGSWDGTVTAWDGADGSVVWKTPLGPTYSHGGGVGSSARISLDGRTAYIGGPDGLWALDVDTGSTVWKHHTGKMVGSSPALSEDGETVFVGCEDGYIYAVAASL